MVTHTPYYVPMLRRPVVIVVGGHDAWIGRVVELAAAAGAIPEVVGPDLLRRRLIPHASAVVVHMAPPYERELALLDSWARFGWQPAVLPSLAPDHGSSGGVESLLRAGYEPHYETGTPRYWRGVECALKRMLESATWLAPALAAGSGCFHGTFLRALRTLVLLPAPTVDVRRWAASLCVGRQQLYQLFDSMNAPRPGAAIAWLKLFRVVDYRSRIRPVTRRSELARRFGYGNGDYLGKRAKLLTGKSLGELVRKGNREFFLLMLRRLREGASINRWCWISPRPAPDPDDCNLSPIGAGFGPPAQIAEER